MIAIGGPTGRQACPGEHGVPHRWTDRANSQGDSAGPEIMKINLRPAEHSRLTGSAYPAMFRHCVSKLGDRIVAILVRRSRSRILRNVVPKNRTYPQFAGAGTPRQTLLD